MIPEVSVAHMVYDHRLGQFEAVRHRRRDYLEFHKSEHDHRGCGHDHPTPGDTRR